MSLLYKTLRRVGYVAGRALRETGQALDRAGSALAGNFAYKEQCSSSLRSVLIFLCPSVGGKSSVGLPPFSFGRSFLSLWLTLLLCLSVNRHRRIMNLYDKTPVVGSNTFIAPNASVIGDVQVGDNTSVWYGTVIRGSFSEKGNIFAASGMVPIESARAGAGVVTYFRNLIL